LKVVVLQAQLLQRIGHPFITLFAPPGRGTSVAVEHRLPEFAYADLERGVLVCVILQRASGSPLLRPGTLNPLQSAENS
jgi:hypothetical protein